MNRNRLYGILSLACLAGYVWLCLNQIRPSFVKEDQATLCLIKHITNIPCPSCGSTRSAMSILHGDYLNGLYLNPLGFILLFIIVAAPMWIIYDLAKKENTLFHFYCKAESILKQKKIAIPAILLIAANWVWNIYKGL